MKKIGILVLGGGPTGLGAAHRLKELGFSDWMLLEQAGRLGGLASSEVDSQGFVWDLGGHVLFSHYEYFDKLLDDLLEGEWIEHQREAWIWMRDRWIPYPFQNNLWRLPPEDLEQCIKGLEKIKENVGRNGGQNFDDWILNSFGSGIADVFMRPYNFKVWAYPTHELSTDWTGERVAEIDKEKILADVISKSDRKGWGPNSVFRFPKSGGTGSIWRELGNRLPSDKIKMGTRVTEINPKEKVVFCDNGQRFSYEKLISTIPITRLLESL
ncbi:MAG: FAD-dependent oxidoreductase, partial [Nitrospinaceae bacterium]|nr:FAD-dependent oxidoreductase [Nitrospinaceae bacterium]